MTQQHFVAKKDDLVLIGMLLTIITLALWFVIAYECTFERKYWINRWRLAKYLYQGKVRIVEVKSFKKFFDKDIVELNAQIDDETYTIWLYNDENSFTMRKVEDHTYYSYIGLFVGSLITQKLTDYTMRKLRELQQQA